MVEVWGKILQEDRLKRSGVGLQMGEVKKNFWEVNAAALDVIFDDKNPGVW